MADDWFKLNMDIFGNRKIKYLRRLPNGDSIALFWIVLLAEARRCNSDGKIFLTENIPYAPDMLAEDFHFEKDTVKLALKTFDQLDMTYTDNGFITITGWEDHQNAEGLAKIREQTRKRVAKHRESKKKSPCNDECNVTVTQCNATEEDKEEDKEEERDIEHIALSCQQIADLFKSICKSFPAIRSLSDARIEKITESLNTYTVDDFKAVFEAAESSSFLKGVDGGWKASFDWLIDKDNMLKVLEGNYTDNPKKGGRKEIVPNWCKDRDEDVEAFETAIQKHRPVFNPNSNSDLADRAEQLKRKLQGE